MCSFPHSKRSALPSAGRAFFVLTADPFSQLPGSGVHTGPGIIRTFLPFLPKNNPSILGSLHLDAGWNFPIIKFRIILKMVLKTVTKYGKKILEIVSSSRSHMTAEEIFDVLRQTYPTVVLATVYNNLNRLWQEDLIRKVSVEGMPDRYDHIRRHDHLVCKRCGKLLDIDLGDLTAQLEEKSGIPILSYDLKLTYLCEDCRNKK